MTHPARLLRESKIKHLDDLTELQAAFVIAYVHGESTAGHGPPSAIAAGYAEGAATRMSSELLNDPRIQHAIKIETWRGLHGTIPIALKEIKRLISSEKTSSAVKAVLIKDVLDRAGFIAPKAREEGAGAKELNEMTQAELKALIAQGAEVLAKQRAERVIDGDIAPVDVPQ